MTDIFAPVVKEETKKKVPCIVDPFPGVEEDHQDQDHLEPLPPHCFNIVR